MVCNCTKFLTTVKFPDCLKKHKSITSLARYHRFSNSMSSCFMWLICVSIILHSYLQQLVQSNNLTNCDTGSYLDIAGKDARCECPSGTCIITLDSGEHLFEDGSITCRGEGDCIIECKDTDICLRAEINCETRGDCHVVCNGIRSCQGADITISPSRFNDATIDCDERGCRFATIISYRDTTVNCGMDDSFDTALRDESCIALELEICDAASDNNDYHGTLNCYQTACCEVDFTCWDQEQCNLLFYDTDDESNLPIGRRCHEHSMNFYCYALVCNVGSLVQRDVCFVYYFFFFGL